MTVSTALRSTTDLADRAVLCLRDPEQTAVAPEVVEPLIELLIAGTANSGNPTSGARDVALMVLQHEHDRITAEPEKPTPGDEPTQQERTADLLDGLATSFGHGNVPDMTPESEDAAFRYLIALRDDVRAGRKL